MVRWLVRGLGMKLGGIIFLISLAMTSVAGAEAVNADRNAQFWSEWQELRQTEKWKALESSTNIVREANPAAGDKAAAKPAPQGNKGGAPQKDSVRDQYIFNMSVDRPREAAKLVAKVATSKIDGADGAIATVVNMRTSPAVRKAAASYVPPAAKKDYLAFVERIPPRRYFSDPFAGTVTTSAFVAASRPAGPAGYVPVKTGSYGCPVR